jgi:signal peptidase
VDGNTVIVGRLPGARLPVAGPPAPASRPGPRSRRARVSRRLGRVALNLTFAAMLLAAAVMLGPAILGFHRYVILTGSMTGTYDRGSIVFDRQVPTSSLKVGDPITYDPPPGFTSQARVSHRIWSIHVGPNGERVFRTKGDANQRPDIWNFTLNHAMQDKVAFHVPELGYLFLMLSIRDFRIVLVGLPTLLIGLVLLRQLWREGGDEAQRQKLAKRGWQAITGPETTAVLRPITAPADERLPAYLALDLRSVAPRWSAAPARLATMHRRRLDLTLPLRVTRLAPSVAGLLHAGTVGIRNHGDGHLVAGSSIATRPLSVRRISRQHV